MVMHDGLPVYREAYSILVETYILGKQFSKDTKYTLGTTLRESAFCTVRCISQANALFEKSERKDKIQEAINALEDYRLAMRVGYDLHEIPLKRFANISEKVESTSKQLFAWQKSMSDKVF
jgi:hypothetical protein